MITYDEYDPRLPSILDLMKHESSRTVMVDAFIYIFLI